MVYKVSDVEPDIGDSLTGSRQCRSCRLTLPISEFYFLTNKQNRRRKCKGCVDAERRERMDRVLADPVEAERYKSQKRWSRIKTRYGVTENDFDLMLRAQDNRCAVCHTDFTDQPPHIDHCHTTERVRGLLCSQCNRGIGQLRDSVEILNRAINYLLSPPTGDAADNWTPENEDKNASRQRRSRAATLSYQSPDRVRARPPVATKLSPDDVTAIRMLLAKGDKSQRVIGEQFGVTQSTISSIKRGILWPAPLEHETTLT